MKNKDDLEDEYDIDIEYSSSRLKNIREKLEEIKCKVLCVVVPTSIVVGLGLVLAGSSESKWLDEACERCAVVSVDGEEIPLRDIYVVYDASDAHLCRKGIYSMDEENNEVYGFYDISTRELVWRGSEPGFYAEKSLDLCDEDDKRKFKKNNYKMTADQLAEDLNIYRSADFSVNSESSVDYKVNVKRK